MKLNPEVEILLLKALEAKSIGPEKRLQSLWSGYGSLTRFPINEGLSTSVIVKHIQAPKASNDRSHQRKLRSYQVELNWYKEWAKRCTNACRIPTLLAQNKQGQEMWLVLEDLDAAGFPGRKQSLAAHEIRACLIWLAHFHATFMGESPTGLWKLGTYWHLDTRPDELAILTDQPLKAAAKAIDQRLRNSPFQTIVHGDAKVANFCFSRDGKRVAAVDFQYVGGGCGMKDVAYFLDSCMNEDACERTETEYLDFYFNGLKSALQQQGSNIDLGALEQDWRALYPYAWTDFHRFLKGWSPGYWNPKGYSEKLAHKVIAEINNEVF